MLIDWYTVAAQIVNFLILVALLKFFLYNRVIKAMDERERQISARLEAAEQQRQAAEEEAASYRQKQRELEAKRAVILARAREDAASQRQELLDHARQEVESVQSRWYQSVREEQEAFLHDLRQRASQQLYAMARRALTDLAHADLEQQMIAAFLDEIHALDENTWNAIATARQGVKQPLVIHSAFDLPPEACQKLQDTLHKHLGESVDIRYETTPEVMCGIELQTDGQKIAWSLQHYLATLEESLATAFEQEIGEVTDANQRGATATARGDERGRS